MAAAAVAVTGLLAACAASPAPGSSRESSSSRARSAIRAPTSGLLPASPELTDRLVLTQTRVTAGTPIKGTLVVTNRSHASINLNRGCRPQFSVVLTNHRFPPTAGFRLDCSAQPFIIAPGETRLAFTVLTTYQTCIQDARHATTLMPACLHAGSVMPSLPPGNYAAVLVGSGLPLPPPAPVPVTLVRRS